MFLLVPLLYSHDFSCVWLCVVSFTVLYWMFVLVPFPYSHKSFRVLRQDTGNEVVVKVREKNTNSDATYKYGLLTTREVKMAGYWPSFFVCVLTTSKKRNETNFQPS